MEHIRAPRDGAIESQEQVLKHLLHCSRNPTSMSIIKYILTPNERSEAFAR